MGSPLYLSISLLPQPLQQLRVFSHLCGQCYRRGDLFPLGSNLRRGTADEVCEAAPTKRPFDPRQTA